MPKNNKYNSMIKVILYLLAFLIPIFFLPITLEPFEFNKIYLATGLTGIMLIIWGIKVIAEKKLEIAKTSLLTPGVLLMTSVIVSTVFSIDKTSSIFGASGRWFPSLNANITLGILYIIISTFIKEKHEIKNILMSFLAGTSLSSLIASLSFFGVLLIPGTDNNFNPTGSLITLGILSALAIVFSLYIQTTQENRAIKAMAVLSFIPNFFYIVAYDNLKVWALLGLGIVLLGASFGTTKIKENRLNGLLVGIIATVILGITTIPATRSVIMRHSYPKEAQLSFKESWNIAISTMRDFPIAGTGPSTFYLNYPRYRSISMNQNENWNLRFDKPQSEVLLVISSLGILGIVVGTYFGIKVTKTIMHTYTKDDLERVVAIMSALMGITLFLTHATVPLGFGLTLMLGIMGSIELSKEQKFLSFKASNEKETITTLSGKNETEGFLTGVIALPLFALATLAFITIYKVYPSEYYMQQAVEALTTDASKSYEFQTKAIKHNPHRSNYYNTFAQTNLAIAINLAGQENLSESDTQTVQNLVATAISTTKASAESINPLNPVNWEIQASIYRAIRDATQDADQWAIRAMESAIKLDPTNPRLRLELGGIYYAKGDFATAASLFRQAINLKADYANAYYNFAQAAKNLEDFATAKRALELTLSLVQTNSEDAEKVRQEMADLDKKLADLGSTQQKPTVEELANQAEVAEKSEGEILPDQEPLIVEGERENFVSPLQGEGTTQSQSELENQLEESNGIVNEDMRNNQQNMQRE